MKPSLIGDGSLSGIDLLARYRMLAWLLKRKHLSMERIGMQTRLNRARAYNRGKILSQSPSPFLPSLITTISTLPGHHFFLSIDIKRSRPIFISVRRLIACEPPANADLIPNCSPTIKQHKTSAGRSLWSRCDFLNTRS